MQIRDVGWQQEWKTELKTKYNIEIGGILPTSFRPNALTSYNRAYNSVQKAEIIRQFGRDVIAEEKMLALKDETQYLNKRNQSQRASRFPRFMSMHPQFLALLVGMLLLVSILGSDHVPWWRIGVLVIIGIAGLWASSGAYSILGSGPAADAAGNLIKDVDGHPLYRREVVDSASGFMTATVYFSFATLIAAPVLAFVKLC